jgi:hypothetical protein
MLVNVMVVDVMVDIQVVVVDIVQMLTTIVVVTVR